MALIRIFPRIKIYCCPSFAYSIVFTIYYYFNNSISNSLLNSIDNSINNIKSARAEILAYSYAKLPSEISCKSTVLSRFYIRPLHCSHFSLGKLTKFGATPIKLTMFPWNRSVCGNTCFCIRCNSDRKLSMELGAGNGSFSHGKNVLCKCGKVCRWYLRVAKCSKRRENERWVNLFLISPLLVDLWLGLAPNLVLVFAMRPHSFAKAARNSTVLRTRYSV